MVQYHPHTFSNLKPKINQQKPFSEIDLVFRDVVQLWIAAQIFAIVRNRVVHQVPAPKKGFAEYYQKLKLCKLESNQEL